MLPLAGPEFPTSADALKIAIEGGLRRFGVAPHEVQVGGMYPALDSVRIDLTGMQASRTQRAPVAAEKASGELLIAKMEIVAAPAYFEDAPLELAIRADHARFSYARDAERQPLLTLSGAAAGSVLIEAKRVALEELLHAVAKETAGKQGVEIKRTHLELTSRGPRLLSFRAEVTAKMFIVSAAITVSGQIAIDDQLTGRLSDLRFTGDGMIANVAGGYIRPLLAQFEGRTVPLLAFSLGDLRLRDLQISGGESLRVSAEFGETTPKLAATAAL